MYIFIHTKCILLIALWQYSVCMSSLNFCRCSWFSATLIPKIPMSHYESFGYGMRLNQSAPAPASPCQRTEPIGMQPVCS